MKSVITGKAFCQDVVRYYCYSESGLYQSYVFHIYLYIVNIFLHYEVFRTDSTDNMPLFLLSGYEHTSAVAMLVF